MIDYQLYLGDCLEYMRGMVDRSVDAVITDPPYGIKHKPNRKQIPKRDDGHIFKTSWDNIIGDNRPFNPEPFLSFPKIILWGAHHYIDKIPQYGGWLIWDKKAPNNYCCSKYDKAWTNFTKETIKFEYMWVGFRRAGEVNQHFHPTQKPVALMRWCIEFISNPGDTIFDPFMGSGTTGVACMQLGRRFIGCEIDPTYYAIAEKRIKQAAAQMLLPLEG